MYEKNTEQGIESVDNRSVDRYSDSQLNRRTVMKTAGAAVFGSLIGSIGVTGAADSAAASPQCDDGGIDHGDIQSESDVHLEPVSISDSDYAIYSQSVAVEYVQTCPGDRHQRNHIFTIQGFGSALLDGGGIPPSIDGHGIEISSPTGVVYQEPVHGDMSWGIGYPGEVFSVNDAFAEILTSVGPHIKARLVSHVARRADLPKRAVEAAMGVAQDQVMKQVQAVNVNESAGSLSQEWNTQDTLRDIIRGEISGETTNVTHAVRCAVQTPPDANTIALDIKSYHKYGWGTIEQAATDRFRFRYREPHSCPHPPCPT